MYHYTESGLSNVYLVNGFEVEYIDGEEYTSIDDMNGLHFAIANAIVDLTRPLTGEEFRFLRIEINLSQKALGVKFGVDEQTVARWEKEKSALPRTSDASLRSLYMDSINKDNGVGLFLEILADAEEKNAAEEIKMEEINNHWKISA
jgi:DNA-binding transcriptional regulator YiaG